MVFFACLLVTLIFYFLQSDGIIYVVIVAVLAEIFNLFMTQTMTATVKNKSHQKYSKIINSHVNKINKQIKTIKQLTKIRDDAIHKLYKANQTIKKYEEQLGIEESEAIDIPQKTDTATEHAKTSDADDKTDEKKDEVKPARPSIAADHLPAGSNRKELPI